MSAAGQLCENNAGQLASVGSQWEQDELLKVAQGLFKNGRGVTAWLGARRKAVGEGWEWLDGRPWSYQNWDEYEPSNETGYDCVNIIFVIETH